MKSRINILIDNFIKKILEIENDSVNLEEKINSINKLLDNLIDFCIKNKIYYYIQNNIGYNQIVNTFKFHLNKFIRKLIDPTDKLVTEYIEKINENLDSYSDINSLLFRKFKAHETLEIKESIIKPKEIQEETKETKEKVKFNDEIDIIGYDYGYDYGNEMKFNYNTIDSDNESLSKLFPKTYTNVKTSINSEKKLSQILNSDESEENNNSNELEDNNNSNKSEDIFDPDNTLDYEENNKLSLYIKIMLSQDKHMLEFIEKLNAMCKIISDPEIEYNHTDPYLEV